MPRKKTKDPWELVGRAIAAIDEQITALRAKHSLLTGLVGQPASAAPQTQRKLSAAVRARISAATKARWARQKQAHATKANPAAAAPAEAESAKAGQ